MSLYVQRKCFTNSNEYHCTNKVWLVYTIKGENCLNMSHSQYITSAFVTYFLWENKHERGDIMEMCFSSCMRSLLYTAIGPPHSSLVIKHSGLYFLVVMVWEAGSVCWEPSVKRPKVHYVTTDLWAIFCTSFSREYHSLICCLFESCTNIWHTLENSEFFSYCYS